MDQEGINLPGTPMWSIIATPISSIKQTEQSHNDQETACVPSSKTEIQGLYSARSKARPCENCVYILNKT